MSKLEIIEVTFLLFISFIGLLRGFIKEFLSILSLIAVPYLIPRISSLLNKDLNLYNLLSIYAASVFCSWIVIKIVCSLPFIKCIRLNPLDRVFGFLLSFCKGFLILSMITLLLSFVHNTTLAENFSDFLPRNSLLQRFLGKSGNYIVRKMLDENQISKIEALGTNYIEKYLRESQKFSYYEEESLHTFHN